MHVHLKDTDFAFQIFLYLLSLKYFAAEYLDSNLLTNFLMHGQVELAKASYAHCFAEQLATTFLKRHKDKK